MGRGEGEEGVQRDRESGGREREVQRKKENLELYYVRIEILGNSLFLQLAFCKLHRHTQKDD